MKLKIPFPPMEGTAVSELPIGSGWQYEPKWDGFRCLIFKTSKGVDLQSKSGQPLNRYFPEVVDCIENLSCSNFVLDSELLVPIESGSSFETLLLRLHPAASRVAKLSKQFPAISFCFDLLEDANGSLVHLPLIERRKKLERFAKKYFHESSCIYLSPATDDPEVARGWIEGKYGSLDGVMAKRTELPYRSGLRDGMLKVKPRKTADCVVGGFRYGKNSSHVGSLLLGLYDHDGLLNHVGFTSSIEKSAKPKLTEKIEALIGEPGFTGNSPGGPSRWSTEEREWKPLKPKLVVEVSYDHFSEGRFRHGTKLLRWRPDKKPSNCLMSQVETEAAGFLAHVLEFNS